MAAGKSEQPPGLAERMRDKTVLISLGAGGVGKTTTSAALALGLAMRGAKVAVVTIDPAPRLATALGLAELSGEPRRIVDETLRGEGLRVEGELWALRLDVKGTFDGIVAGLEPDASVREEILANPVYRELSSAVAGSHELSAVAKLHELHEEHDFDVIVLDTPPSRNALDFLEAPSRLLGFLDGRALQVFLSPGGMTARLFGRGTALVFSIFARVTGVDMLSELSRFFRSLGGVIDGFRERTRGVEEILRSPRTAFLIVTSPEREAAREARFLAGRLAQAGRPAAELIVNRVHTNGLEGQDVQQLADELAARLGESLGARVANNLSDFDILARRDRETIAELTATLEGPADPIIVGQLDEEVQDLLGLARIAEQLLG
jgi:anion-transporting  ArsA/GET3 family ATPase